MDDAKKIFERHGLTRARRIAGLTQTDLARKLRVTTSAVSAWESGIRTPSAGLIPSLADHLDITPAALLDLIEAPALTH
jgi:transcriptional regulator with XRE-family HTH domain